MAMDAAGNFSIFSFEQNSSFYICNITSLFVLCKNQPIARI